MKAERGSGTVLAVGLIGAAVSLFIGASTIANVWVSQLKLQQAAETSALAAADSLRGLATGFPCEVAKQISTANMANLTECRIVGLSIYIKVQSNALGIVLSAKALAGA